MPSKPNINRIAFITPNGQLGTMAPTGGELQLLTHSDHFFQFPAWSPDNEALAAIGSNRAETNICVVHESTLLLAATAHPVYASQDQPPIYLCWSPDSRLISYLALHPTQGLAIYLVSGDGSQRVLNNAPAIGGQPCFWQWRSDSSGFLAHVDLGGKPARLAFVNLHEGGARTSVRDFDVLPGHFQAPAIAADGSAWAYAVRDPGANGESRIVAEIGNRKRINIEHAGLLALNWSPTSPQLAFIHPKSPAQNFHGPLRLWDANTGEMQRLTEEEVLAFFWSPDGQQIAYFVLAQAPARPPLAPSTNGKFHGNWPFTQPQPSASLWLALHVIDTSSTQDRLLQVFEPAPPFIHRFLPFFDQYAKSHSLWSPASDALVLPILQHGHPEICIIPIDGSPLRAITPGVMATWSW